MALTTWDTNELTGLLLKAGRTALRLLDETEPELKEDRSIVTRADMEIEAELAARFDAPGEGVYLIGEETKDEYDESYVQRALDGTTWVVDPIDGTSSYAHRLPTWGISIGLMKERRLAEGAIFLPLTGELLISQGSAVRMWDLGCEPSRWEAGVSHGRTLDPDSVRSIPNPGRGIVSLAQGVVKRGRFSGDYHVHAIGSCVYSVASLVRGSFTGYVASVKLWDIAAGIPILAKLGFVMKLADGTRYVDTVDEKSYHLGTDPARRWRMRTTLFVAHDEATCDDLIAATHLEG